MELYILNKDLELKGVLDTFTSLRWIRKYFKTGEFELHCALNNNTLNLLKKDNLLYKKDDFEAGYIETRQLKVNEEGKEILVVKGKFLTNYLNNRIIWQRVNFNGKTEDLMRKLVNDNAINTININRKVNNLILGSLKGFTEDIKYQNSFGNVLEQLESISYTSNLGYRNILDIKNKKIIFDIYKGVNRTVSNGTIAPCIFSRDFENILEQEYTDSSNNYKNTCLIAGAGEGEERIIASIEKGKGLDRKELFVDARDLQKQSENNGVKKVLSENEYREILIQRGLQKLSDYKEIKTFNSKINAQGNNKYKINFDLGDVVTIVDKKWNIQLDTRITEIEEVYEEKGLEVNITFGNNIPTIIELLQKGR